MSILLIGSSGYIGSILYYKLSKIGHDITTVDLKWFDGPPTIKNCDYSGLKNIKQYDIIILLAGHSSIAMCEDDPCGAIKNNLYNFSILADQLTNEQIFIFASSAGVYGNICYNDNGKSKESDRLSEPSTVYDLTMLARENYMHMVHPKKLFYGLRFATVNGWSPHIRSDLMINKMIDTYQHTKSIVVSNTNTRRAILGTNDLCRAIITIIKDRKHPGIYNLSSFNSTVGEVAKEISKFLQCELIIEDSERAKFNYWLDTYKFCAAFDFSFSDTVTNIANTLTSSFCSYKSTRTKTLIKYV